MDDMGYGDLVSYGGTGYNTPHIEKLANEGMRFTNFYAVQPICSASRAGLLTGCYPNRIGISGALGPLSPVGISDNEQTIAALLKAVNYRTAIIGKWHLGDDQKFLPLQHGFDEFLGLPYSNDMWPVNYDGKPADSTNLRKFSKPPLPLIRGNSVIRHLRTLKDQDELTTMFTNEAIHFINENKNRPFFLYLAPSMVHVPLAVSDKFRGKSKQGLFGDVMMEVDWSVEQLINALKQNGIENNTVFIFTSDNGPWLSFGNHAGSAGGLREGKATSWDGGHKVPAIVKWPKVVPSGTVCNQLASNIDLLPTIIAIAGAPLPKNKIDGVNILPLLKGDFDANPRDHLFYYFKTNSLEGVRQENWKLVFAHSFQSYERELPGQDGFPGLTHKDTTDMALFDLRRDPGEQYDVKKQRPDIVRTLLELAEQAREDLGDDLTNRPGKNRRPPGKIDR